jgi:hypothetical protein
MVLVRSASLAAAAFFALAGTAAAAPSVTVDRQCYAHLPSRGSEPISAVITGGTPGADFNLIARGLKGQTAGEASGTFDAAGAATAQILDIRPPSGSIKPNKGEPVTFVVQDTGTQTETTSGGALVTTISMTVSAKPRNPRLARAITVSGGRVFAHKTLFGFVTKPGSGKVLRRVRVGKTNICGYAKTKQVVAPRGAGAGNFRIYVNPGAKLDKPNAIYFSFRIFRF